MAILMVIRSYPTFRILISTIIGLVQCNLAVCRDLDPTFGSLTSIRQPYNTGQMGHLMEVHRFRALYTFIACLP